MRYVDIHTHGIGRFDTRTGGAAAVLSMARLHGQAGTGAIVPTVYSGALGHMRAALAAIDDAMRAQLRDASLRRGHARILGAHLEGPFLNPVKCGALDRASFVPPSAGALDRLIDGYEKTVRIITVSPELPGAPGVISRAAHMGIRVQMGHSAATIKEARAGMRAGASGVTHIFNAMNPLHHREPGLVGLALTEPSLYVELIGDMKHVAPEAVRVVFALKGWRRVMLVSDSVKGPGTRAGVLQGGKATLAEAVERVTKAGVPGREAMASASRVPAGYLEIR